MHGRIVADLAHRPARRVGRHAGLGSVLAGIGLALLFAYAVSWACACVGVIAKGPESGASMGLVVAVSLGDRL